MGATAEGKNELLAAVDGHQESEASWTEILLSLKDLGLTVAPKLATGDTSLGFWLTMSKVFPQTKQQRCWVHKTANVLGKLPVDAPEPSSRAIYRLELYEDGDYLNSHHIP